MKRIFIVEDERRDWRRRIAQASQKRQPAPEVTRRYLMMVPDPTLKGVIRNHFETFPYKGGDFNDIFYCLAGSSSRRSRDFVRSLLHFFSKDLDAKAAGEIEIFHGTRAASELMESYEGRGKVAF